MFRPADAGRSVRALMLEIEDNRPNMETYHERTCRRSRIGRIDRRSYLRSAGQRGPGVPGEFVIWV
jgi:hypothetical protein